MYSLEKLLGHVVENNASDLHLSIGTQPRMRQNGILVPIDGEKLTPTMLRILDGPMGSLFDSDEALEEA